MAIKPPFPYFGGKSRVAPLVWARFGSDIYQYVEPFFGSGAVLFGSPYVPNMETVNDIDCLIVNFWRAVKIAPKEVAMFADNPVFEGDLTARHIWLVQYAIPELRKRIPANPDYYDAKVAGYWVWGMSSWIGGGWCSGKGPWREENGVIVKISDAEDSCTGDETSKRLVGVSRRRPHLSRGGQGINRVSLYSSSEGVSRRRPHLGHGEGINRKVIGQGWETSVQDRREGLTQYMYALANRLRNVRVCCGDWKRVVTRGALSKSYNERTAVFLDPPYSHNDRDDNLYTYDTKDLRDEVMEWCMMHDKNIKIALCGYEGEYNALEDRGWSKIVWVAMRSYSSSRNSSRNAENRFKERIWFSPLCDANVDQDEEQASAGQLHLFTSADEE